MNSDEILTNLSSSAYTLINDRMLRGLGGNAYAAVILAKLMSFYKYYYDAKLLTSDGYFFQTIDDLERLCGISENYQRSAIRFLESNGFLSVRIAGSPPKRFFKLHTDTIIAIMENPPTKKLYKGLTKEEKKIEQKAFYNELNPALVFSWKLTKERGGNIPHKLLWFMFVWQDYMKHKGGFEWNTVLYGELRNYWRVQYGVKEFDYKILHDFMETDEPKTIYNFISYDRRTPERPPSERLYYYNFDIKGEHYDVNGQEEKWRF